ncbi:dynein light chain Tctex-type protein 2B isoform X2 [Toxotes jaculatrix]|uniref:dynein light chain Tctex-type protein 2B isoform X2 n=1 Tax=Toxotes jaculatrix TaxID=941984 RepID=UPI001B3AF3F5|nr:dynein light chain Tctex-type protein 2B isoform X2 [Toxotes jaculatrix]
MEGSDTYIIRPNHQHKFKTAIVKEYIREIVRERLSGVQYDPEEVPELSRSLADSIKDKVKNAGFDRYKLVVQVVIGEQRGQGVKMSSRCLWDADTDNYAEDVFMNLVLCGGSFRKLLLLRMRGWMTGFFQMKRYSTVRRSTFMQIIL